jgi:hypothetical protein
MVGNFIKRSPFVIVLLVCGILMFWNTGARAQTANPDDITGHWRVIGNNTSGDLRLTQNGGRLSGTIFGHEIEGFYIISIRRLVFMRDNANGVPIQLYEAEVSTRGLRMGGEFTIWNGRGGNIGEEGFHYNFSGTKVSDTP